MNKENLKKLANQFMTKTLAVKPDDSVWISYQGDASWPLAEACMLECKLYGSNPHMTDTGRASWRRLLDESSKLPDQVAYLTEIGKMHLRQMKETTHYLKIDEIANPNRAVLSSEEGRLITDLIGADANDWRRKNTRWLIVDAPTAEFARSCGMSKADSDQFFLNACLANYDVISDRIEPLQEVMSGRKHFEVTGRKTKLTGQFADVQAIPCVGEQNLPDGECYTAPLAGSINGHVLFEKSPQRGHVFPWIYMEVENGFIVYAKSETDELTKALNDILDTDTGSRQFGEWAIAFNPMINKLIGNVLFDEKVTGTMHMAVGRCLPKTPNGVESKLHWDLVLDQRELAGGGNIIVDDELIRQDGLFVPKRLQGLNPQNLIL